MKIYIRVFLLVGSLNFILGCQTSTVSLNESLVAKQETSVQTSDYHHQMALGYSQQRQSTQAIEHFREALRLDNQNITLHLELADEYQKIGFNQLAYYELNEALRIKNDDERALAQLASLYVDSKIYSKAEVIYQKLLTLSPAHRQYLWALFYLQKAQNHLVEALNQLMQMPLVEEEKYKVSFEKALIYKQLNKKSLYEQFLNEAYQLNSRDRMTSLEMTSFLFKQKKYQAAIEILKGYSDTHDFDLEISENLSYAALRTKNNELAQKEFDRQRLWAKDRVDVNIKKGQIYLLDE